jgi:alkanesulfonate monooxygenase SsuD/methylene tetrahydromethanopterin reductase-like flavin-dependent oxidoreductase (luciferase family)
VIVAATRHLGLGATLSTSFHTAYHLARWLGSLDVMSGGRRHVRPREGALRQL